MKKHILKIREVDKIFFDSIKDRTKTIETRAATPKYRKIQKSDILIFTCGKENIERMVQEVFFFKNIDELLETMDLKTIMPQASSKEEAIKTWHSFPNYQEKIAQYGLVAWVLD